MEKTGGVYRYSYPSAGEPTFVECYGAFQAVDVAWQIANEDDSPTQVALRECLAAEGVAAAPTVEGVMSQVARLGIDPAECTLGENAPPLPSWIVDSWTAERDG